MACELDRTSMGGIERGERNLALRNIERIAQALDMTVLPLLEDVYTADFPTACSRRSSNI